MSIVVFFRSAYCKYDEFHHGHAGVIHTTNAAKEPLSMVLPLESMWCKYELWLPINSRLFAPFCQEIHPKVDRLETARHLVHW